MKTLVAAMTAALMLAGAQPAHAQPRHHVRHVWVTKHYRYGPTARQSVTVTYQTGRRKAHWVMSIHGGGWVSQDATTMEGADERFQAARYDTFAINYDLATTPAITEYVQRADVQRAVRWIRSHSRAFGINPNRGAVYGYSAGGQLALEVGLSTPGIRAVLATSPIAQPSRVADDYAGVRPDSEPSNVALAGLYPNAVRLTGGCDYRSGIVQSDVCAKRWSDLDPLSYVRTGSAPVLLLAGADDTFYTAQQSEAFCYWMRYGMGGRCTAVVRAGYGHGQQVFLDDPKEGMGFLRHHD